MSYALIRYRNGRGTRLVPIGAWSWARSERQVGALSLTLPTDADVQIGDMLRIIQHSGQQRRWVERQSWTVQAFDERDGLRTWTAYDSLYLLNQYVLFEQTYSGARDNVLRQIVRDTLLDGGIAGRAQSNLSVEPNQSDAATGEHTVSGAVLDVVRQVAEAATEAGTWLSFDLTNSLTSDLWTFRVLAGRRGMDRRAGQAGAVRLGSSNGTATDVQQREDWSSYRSVAYVQGGLGIVGYVQRPAAMEQSGRYAWRETLESKGGTTDPAEVVSAAQALLDRAQPQRSRSLTLVSTPAVQFGRDYGYGDLVTVDGDEYRISGYRVTVDGAMATPEIKIEAL